RPLHTRVPFDIGASDFFRHLSFVIRHWTTGSWSPMQPKRERGSPRKSIAQFLALFVRSLEMPESTDILLARPTVVPPLDPEFRPVALGNRRYRQAVAAAKTKVPLAIALERNDGRVSVFKTEILSDGSGHGAATRLYVERLVKFLLWQFGGWKILIGGPREIGRFVAQTYAHSGARAFDAGLLEQVYERPFTVETTDWAKVPVARESCVALGGH